MDIIATQQIHSPMGVIILQRCGLDDADNIADYAEIPSDLYAEINNPHGDGKGIYYRAWWTAQNGQQCGTASITESGAVGNAIAAAGRWWSQNNVARLA